MDAITGFVYGMSMMFFSMMAWMFWRKGVTGSFASS